MGAAGSVLPATEEDALKMGYTQEQIDQYKAQIRSDEQKESISTVENMPADTTTSATTTPANESTPSDTSLPVDTAPADTKTTAGATTTPSTINDNPSDVIDAEDIIEVKVRPVEERLAELGPGSINVNRECIPFHLVFVVVAPVYFPSHLVFLLLLHMYSMCVYAARLIANIEAIRKTVSETMVFALRTYLVRTILLSTLQLSFPPSAKGAKRVAP